MRRRRSRGDSRGTIRFEIPPYKRRKFISLLIVGIFFLSAVLSYYAVDLRLRPILRDLALARARSLATMTVQKAVAEGEARSIKYRDLIAVHTDQDGRPVLLQPNTGELNRLAAQITLDVQRALSGLEQTKIKLPMGQVLGSQLLGTWGPVIGVNLMPVGTVEGQIVDSFSVAGINQTRHRISLRVETEVKVVVPLVSSSARIRTDVPLAEAVIMGQVPQVYLGGGVIGGK